METVGATTRPVTQVEVVAVNNASTKAAPLPFAELIGRHSNAVPINITTTKLKRIDPALYSKVRKVLDINKEERHIRGGIATREKYKREAVALKR